MKKEIKISIAACLFLCATVAFSQEVEDAAKAAQNPLANVISMPFQNNNDFGIGIYDKTSNVLNIQPILPVSLSKSGWLLINRFIIPFPKSFPDLTSEDAKNSTDKSCSQQLRNLLPDSGPEPGF